MSKINKEKIEVVKDILRRIHQGEDINSIKMRFRDVLSNVMPFEIPLIEQELVKQGIKVSDILKLCDIHVELFKEFLESQELKDVPKGHPIDLLMRENHHILKQAEVLGVYANALIKAKDANEIRRITSTIGKILGEVRKFRLHYRKIQMLIFPYLERRGIVAVPRVLWGREEQVIKMIRELNELIKMLDTFPKSYSKLVAERALEISRQASELVFRENKILFPAVLALLSEGEWRVVHEIGREIGYIIDIGEGDNWKTNALPIYPYEIDSSITSEQMDKLPEEFKKMVLKTLTPDTYKLKKEGDLNFDTGFLDVKEVDGIFRALPIEVTYANADDRVQFYSQSDFHKGFIRTKTILGRRIEYCHPPGLEKMVMSNVEKIKKGESEHLVFWTKMGGRVIRVIIKGVKDKEGKLLGILEMVEDLTEVVNNSDAVKEKIVVL